jgi:hypothetical protein
MVDFSRFHQTNGGKYSKPGDTSTGRLTSSYRHKSSLPVLMALFCWAAAGAQASQSDRGEVVIDSQFVDGPGWQSTLEITSLAAATVNVTLYKDIGGGATQGWDLFGTETTTYTVPAGGTLILQSPGTSPAVTTGWVKVEANATIIADTLFDAYVTGRPTESGIAEGTTGSTDVGFFFDQTNGKASAVAIVNPTPDDETILAAFQSNSGVTTQLPPVTVPSLGHLDFALSAEDPSTANLAGIIEFYSPNGPFAIEALEFNAGGFTSLPVHPIMGPLLVSDAPPSFTGYFGGLGGSGATGPAANADLLVLDLAQNGQTVAGKFDFASIDDIFVSGFVTGTVSGSGGNTLTFSATPAFSPNGCAITLHGSATYTHGSLEASVDVGFDPSPSCGSNAGSTSSALISLAPLAGVYSGTYTGSSDSGDIIFGLTDSGTGGGAWVPTSGSTLSPTIFAGVGNGNNYTFLTYGSSPETFTGMLGPMMTGFLPSGSPYWALLTL